MWVNSAHSSSSKLEDGVAGVQALVWGCPLLQVPLEGWGCVPADQKHPLPCVLHLFSGPLGLVMGLVAFRASQVQEVSHYTAMQILHHTGMVQGGQCRIGRLPLVSIDQCVMFLSAA